VQARTQQNNSLSPLRQQKIAKDRQENPKAQLEQKTVQARREIKTLTVWCHELNKIFPPTATQTKNGESQTSNSHEPNKKSLPPLKPKAAKAKQIIAQAKQSQINNK
jgi:hypothetical protein